ncbi:hypothetical protein SAMN05192558_1045 [Actinokineospora alba]|uniref:Uncharacterized protein n=1 Tax=Actinokineospora alba TaxID=504798 RepID=A0A1H0L4U2_9PSEU|nr:hypothetical protein C8E96_2724 [Actinokineospora alba]SDJ04866.1 hypothetical protein SAMN05421871_109294 [Actinokineospora alba]SDO62980.1 hypothetical protein SAMN05192558_1045 [Actinokineospora alba]
MSHTASADCTNWRESWPVIDSSSTCEAKASGASTPRSRGHRAIVQHPGSGDQGRRKGGRLFVRHPCPECTATSGEAASSSPGPRCSIRWLKALERERQDRGGKLLGRNLPVDAVPLDQRVDKPNRCRLTRSGSRVATQSTSSTACLTRVCGVSGDTSATLKSPHLGTTTTVHAGQKGDRGLVCHQHLDAAAHRIVQSFGGRPLCFRGDANRLAQLVASLVECLGRQLFPARHVTVDG